ncbi:MAG: putative salt-induced outer membrane protein [Sulfurimonas sp.]
MKKIVISLAVCTSLLLAADVATDQSQLKNEIKQTKEQIKVLDEKIKTLEGQLPPNEKIMTHTELGFIQTQGNTDSTTFNLDLKAKKGWGNHSLEISSDAQYAIDSGVETKNKYAVELEYGYALKNDLFITYLAGYKKDMFSGYDYQAYTGPGLKYTTIKTKNHLLNIEGSFLYSQDDIEDTQYDSSGNTISYPNSDNVAVASTTYGEIDNYASYRVKAIYNWQMLKNLKFDQELSYKSDFDDSSMSFIYSKTALSSRLSRIFSAGISYKVDYSNSPQAGIEYADRTFTANLIIDY